MSLYQNSPFFEVNLAPADFVSSMYRFVNVSPSKCCKNQELACFCSISTHYIWKLFPLCKYVFSHMLIINIMLQQFISDTIRHVDIDLVPTDFKEEAEYLYLVFWVLFSHLSYSLFLGDLCCTAPPHLESCVQNGLRIWQNAIRLQIM